MFIYYFNWTHVCIFLEWHHPYNGFKVYTSIMQTFSCWDDDQRHYAKAKTTVRFNSLLIIIIVPNINDIWDCPCRRIWNRGWMWYSVVLLINVVSILTEDVTTVLYTCYSNAKYTNMRNAKSGVLSVHKLFMISCPHIHY